MKETKMYRRICIQRNGYAIVPGDTDEEALANAETLSASDFDWEPVTPELIQDEATVIETCGPTGETL